MITHPQPFHADLYRGHFERGGTVIASQILLQITNVIYFKKFDAKASHPEQLQYLVFGDATEQFLAHLITSKPDFDQILSTHGITGILPRILEFAESPPESPLMETAVRKEIYLETGDLSD